MSTPGHAVHLTSREQQNGGAPGGKLPQQLSKPHQPQLVSSSNETVHQQLAAAAGNSHAHLHTDPRVMASGGGLHGPPPPKVEAIGMMDAWSRMPPQYASQATSLEPQFIGSSPAAYYHAPVSPYGAAYAGIGSETAGAPWSNGTDVASYFGYPPSSADFHHPKSISIPGMFGNGYPAGTYGAAPSSFGFSPFTPTHTGPSQDYTGWTADVLDRGAHQKSHPYGDYYSYDLINPAATPGMIAPPLGGGPMTINCDDRVKSLGNQMENLSIAPMALGKHDFERQAVESGPAEVASPENPKKAETGLAKECLAENQGEPIVKAENNNNDDDAGGDDEDSKVITSLKAQALTDDTPVENHDEEPAESVSGPTTATKESNWSEQSNWNWIDDEVKDWSASPPPPAIPTNEDGHDEDVDGDGGSDEQTSKHLLEDLIRKNNYNPSELDARIEGARFFVIKSYSEDDVHRSIKYSIWCSTEHGNKKLDQAFRHQKNNGANPIYLFYSVNGSGHFCGMAQMTSSVDYETMTGVWAQDKWKGKFNVKWIYVKDIPNPELRHIRLENNENKPVTNSRDTQEIPPEKGRQVLEIMHKYRHETSLFDDFVYYEDMEHKREAEREYHQTKDRSSSPVARSAAFRNFPPKRKDYGDDVGHPSNGNHHHHHHRENHHHGKDYRDPRNSSAGGGRSFSGASNSGSYNHRDSRGFGGYHGGETGDSRGNVGRSFTNFRRDRDFSERAFFSNRTTVRNDTAHWRS